MLASQLEVLVSALDKKRYERYTFWKERDKILFEDGIYIYVENSKSPTK